MMETENTGQVNILPIRVRGKYSKKFNDIDVISNHYKVKVAPFEKIVIFRIKITPTIPADNRKQREEILKKISNDLKTMIKNPIISGMCVYSTEEAKEKEKQFSAGEYKVGIKQVKVFNVKQNPRLLLVFLNNGLRSALSQQGFCQIGKSGKFFNTKDKQNIDNIMMFSGYKSNFVSLEGGIYLRVDSAKKIVRNETVLDFINKFYKIHDGKEKEEKRNLLKNELVGQIVMANYGKPRYFRISDLHFKKIEEIFLDNSGTNLKEYYKTKYQMEIKNMGQPLLLIEDKDNKHKVAEETRGPCYAIPEFCLMTGIPDDFDENRRRAISTHTIKNPKEKLREIGGLMERFKNDQEFKKLKELGITVDTQLKGVSAKQIKTPTLLLGGRNSVQRGKESNFQLHSKPIYNAKYDVKLGAVFVKGTNIGAIIDTMQKTAPNLGVTLTIKNFEATRRDIRDLISLVGKAADADCNICMVILPNNLKNNYKDLKFDTIKREKMVTQVVTEATLNKKNLQSVATKVLLQIIAKRGNTLWIPEIDSSIKETMLLGFDSAKCGNGTVLSASSTLSSTFSSIYTVCQKYSSQQDKFKVLVALAGQCISAYVKRNDKPPKEIIVGMNSCTGDVVKVYHELFCQALITFVRESFNGHTIGLNFVMINLKTSERFFSGKEGGQIRNVPAGTLICEDLVSPFYDFYIVSQQSTRGTVVPNHYKVIYSNSRLEEGVIQDLLFGQCFNYVNWTGSIKVPSVMQYAKKNAKFLSEVMGGSENLKEDIPEDLCGKLYFV